MAGGTEYNFYQHQQQQQQHLDLEKSTEITLTFISSTWCHKLCAFHVHYFT